MKTWYGLQSADSKARISVVLQKTFGYGASQRSCADATAMRTASVDRRAIMITVGSECGEAGEMSAKKPVLN
jgi:hypothetical protein